MSEDMSEKMSIEVSEFFPRADGFKLGQRKKCQKRMSENMSERMSEDMSEKNVRRCVRWNVSIERSLLNSRREGPSQTFMSLKLGFQLRV